jgi:autotransporter-associated beta strand protein
VDSNLTGSLQVVIGDPASFGTMRNPHGEDQFSTVTLTGLNTYTGGTVLNAGTLSARPRSLGTGPLTVQPNSFPTPQDPIHGAPRFESFEQGAKFTQNIVLNGSLALVGDNYTTLAGTISGAGTLFIDRNAGDLLTLTAANTYTGGTVFRSGTLGLGHDNALGAGAFSIHPDAQLYTSGGPRTLANSITLLDDAESYDAPRLRVAGNHSLTLNGPVSINTTFGYAYVSDTSDERPTLPLLRFNGGISGDAELIFEMGNDNNTRIWLAGANTYTGGTSVSNGQVIFDSLASLPTIGELSNYSEGYIGLATPAANLQTAYIDRFSQGYGQVIGFDSPDVNAPQIFSANIDLRGLSYPYLSSSTAAILTGTITPFEDVYRFAGNGSGVLTVASALIGNRQLRMDNTSAPLLLRLTGTNTYTGQTSVNGTGLIFATAASLPAGQHFAPHPSIGAYFGYEDPAISVGSFLSHFSPSTTHAVVGFDSVDVQSPRTITSPDLSYFNTSTDIYLGTATSAIIDGTITWPTLNSGYNFAAYRTGRLTVNSTLGGSGIVRIGNEKQQWTLTEVHGALPTVELAGNNTYTGGTYFSGGQLVLSHANALGTGTLTVRIPYHSDFKVHQLLLNTPSVANNLFLENYSIDLRLATTQSVGTLSGQIGGSGNLLKVGANTIRLTGTNSFVGDLLVEQGVLEFANAAAVGGSTDNRLFLQGIGATAHFSAGNPVIGALLSDPDTGGTVQIDNGVNLRLGAHDSGYAYETNDYHGTITGAGSLTKDGLSTVTLHGANTFTGGTTITQGVLLAENATALGTGAITLNGGELAFGRGITIANAISFGASGGLLSGASTFSGPVVLGAQAGLSPGNSPGTMTFASDLTLAGASFLDFEIQDPTGLAGAGYDTLSVGGTLFVTSTPGTPFVINILSLDGAGNGGQLQISDPNASYSLLVVSAGLVSGFAPENFTLNTAGFSTNWGSNYSFSLVQSGNQLLLNFSPVPEPSTYALLGLGGLLAGLARWRRRFNRRD